VDFVSSHVYGNDKGKDVLGTDENIPRDQMVCRGVRKVRDQIRASIMPNLPLIWTEYNASYKNEPAITDSLYMGPWIADTISQCDGLTQMMSYWTFSDVFEEQGVVKEPFYGGFGLIAAGNIPKPAYNAFKLLHQLGDKRIPVDSSNALATRRADGTLVVAAWNLVDPDKNQNGSSQTILLRFEHFSGTHTASIARLDSTHGDVHASYEKMGQLRYPTSDQLKALRQSAQLPPAESHDLTNGELTLDLPPDGLAVIEIK
jgi:xylan 1,4-beta-xylosidase